MFLSVVGPMLCWLQTLLQVAAPPGTDKGGIRAQRFCRQIPPCDWSLAVWSIRGLCSSGVSSLPSSILGSFTSWYRGCPSNPSSSDWTFLPSKLSGRREALPTIFSRVGCHSCRQFLLPPPPPHWNGKRGSDPERSSTLCTLQACISSPLLC